MSNFDFDIVIDLDDFKRFEHIFDKIGVKVEQAIKEGIFDLAKQSEEKLKENLNRFGLGGSRLASSARAEMVDDLTFKLVVDASVQTENDGLVEYAMFVEFGTGVIGKAVPHPNPNFGGYGFKSWTYDSKGHGEYGWGYIKDNKLYWTLGQQARPFMYLTWKWIRESGTNIIQGHVNRALKELAK